MTHIDKCPFCGSKDTRTSGTTDRAAYCGNCRREFEVDADGHVLDDGVCGYGPPEKFAMRNERHAQAQRRRLLEGKRPSNSRLKGGLG